MTAPPVTSIIQRCYEVSRTHTRLGDQSFTVARPRLWNNLPLHLCDSELTLLLFHQLLKTHLFSWGPLCLVTVAVLEHVINVVSNIHTSHIHRPHHHGNNLTNSQKYSVRMVFPANLKTYNWQASSTLSLQTLSTVMLTGQTTRNCRKCRCWLCGRTRCWAPTLRFVQSKAQWIRK